MRKLRKRILASVLAAMFVAGCSDTTPDNNFVILDNQNPQQQPLQIPNRIVFAVNQGGNLISFNAQTPGTLASSVALTGLNGETLLGIDVRPSNGLLYGITSGNRLVTINPNTGAVTNVTNTLFNPTLAGTSFGVDFNPVVDRLRVVSNTGQNLRINPDTAAVTVDTNLAFVQGDSSFGINPQIAGAAYANNFAGTTNTTLFNIDSNRDAIVLQENPNAGTLRTLAGLNFNTSNQVGFDITNDNIGIASLTPETGGNSQLFVIDPANSRIQSVGAINSATPITSLAISPIGTVLPNALAIDNQNRLVRFNLATPGNVTVVANVTGVPAGASVVGMDYRPATGEVFVATDGPGAANIFTLNRTTGALTQVGNSATALDNFSDYGFDFNPTVDLIRAVAATNNTVLNPGTNVRTTQTTLAYAGNDPGTGTTPNVRGAGYTNSFAGSTATQLFVIETARNVLALQNPPAGGVLTTIGNLGVTTSPNTSFDITPDNQAFLVTRTTQGAQSSTLLRVNLTSGAATNGTAIGGSPINAFTILPFGL